MTIFKRGKRTLGWLIGKSVPFLNLFRRPKTFPYELNELRDFPRGTLGAETALFLDKRNMDFLPKYETHDLVHTLLGYDATTTGELRLQAFMCGNGTASFAGRVLFLVGLIFIPKIWRNTGRDIARGKKAERIFGDQLVSLLNQDIDDLRQMYNIESACGRMRLDSRG